MLTRFVLAVTLVAGAGGAADPGTFLAAITKVEGDTVTFKKATYHPGKGGAERYSYGEPMTAKVAKDAAITQGHFLPDDAGTGGRVTGKSAPVKGGLDDLAKRVNTGKAPRPCLMTAADQGAEKGTITAINVWASGSPK